MRPRGTLAGALIVLIATASGANAPPRRAAAWLADPRSAVLILLGSIVVLGIGRKLLGEHRSRQAVARLAHDDATPAEVAAASAAGRGAMTELARLCETGATPALRHAAATSLLTLWAGDQLVAEEERAIAARLFEVQWKARRRYPRELSRPLGMEVRFGLMGVGPSSPIRAEELLWSHRVVGSQRAAMEVFSDWQRGREAVAWALEPADFPGPGPHRLILETRLRWESSGGTWELGLPPSALSFELDPRLTLAAILGAPEEELTRRGAERVRLEPAEETGTAFQALNDRFALRDPPRIVIAGTLPYDLAHRVSIEFDAPPTRCDALSIVLLATGGGDHDPTDRRILPFPSWLGPPEVPIDRPGPVRVRAVLTPDPELAWSDPAVRALWPVPLVTNWCDVRIVRL